MSFLRVCMSGRRSIYLLPAHVPPLQVPKHFKLAWIQNDLGLGQGRIPAIVAGIFWVGGGTEYVGHLLRLSRC